MQHFEFKQLREMLGQILGTKEGLILYHNSQASEKSSVNHHFSQFIYVFLYFAFY